MYKWWKAYTSPYSTRTTGRGPPGRTKLMRVGGAHLSQLRHATSFPLSPMESHVGHPGVRLMSDSQRRCFLSFSLTLNHSLRFWLSPDTYAFHQICQRTGWVPLECCIAVRAFSQIKAEGTVRVRRDRVCLLYSCLSTSRNGRDRDQKAPHSSSSATSPPLTRRQQSIAAFFLQREENRPLK